MYYVVLIILVTLLAMCDSPMASLINYKCSIADVLPYSLCKSNQK